MIRKITDRVKLKRTLLSAIPIFMLHEGLPDHFPLPKRPQWDSSTQTQSTRSRPPFRMSTGEIRAGQEIRIDSREGRLRNLRQLRQREKIQAFKKWESLSELYRPIQAIQAAVSGNFILVPGLSES